MPPGSRVRTAGPDLTWCSLLGRWARTPWSVLVEGDLGIVLCRYRIFHRWTCRAILVPIFPRHCLTFSPGSHSWNISDFRYLICDEWSHYSEFQKVQVLVCKI